MTAMKLICWIIGTFTATEKAGELIMEPPQQNTVNLRRIVFFDITNNSFEWRSASSEDSGKTWKVSRSLSATRVK
jgi:hypothetical protein